MENKKSFNADAMVAGFVIGLGLFVVDFLSILMRWETGGGALRNMLILILVIGGAVYFTRKRAALAGPAGMTYGRCLGFTVVSMIYAGLLVGIGDVILYKMIFPAYYNEFVDTAIKASGKMLKNNPLFAGNQGQLKQSLEISRMLMTSPVFIILRNVFNVVLLGTLAGLFTSVLCKRPADPFYESQNNE
ncbi:MAG: DUF4199 domain-containing protein [Rikenellaceae bacterium]|jgi:hypothetical protein|nr:DUF4199 domain-containing protein [Rikenellaceae bacterium]